jgi:nicotinate dehydrogenase subunit A
MTRTTVNGRAVTLDLDPSTPLIFVLRNDLALNGPKLGCGVAQCGACTVHLDGQPVRACVTPLAAAEGRTVLTLEGLGTPERPHPLQTAFLAEQAAQCGYCTNGMIMQAAALIAGKPTVSEAEIRDGLAGNLCRCGCQGRVIAAVQRAARAGA